MFERSGLQCLRICGFGGWGGGGGGAFLFARVGLRVFRGLGLIGV